MNSIEASYCATWFHRTVTIFITIFTIGRLAVDLPHDCGSGESRSPTYLKPHRTAGRIRGRTPRSQSDRTAIAARSSRDRGSFDVEAKPRSRRTFSAEDGKRNVHDRGPITSGSWTDHCLIMATFKRDQSFFWSEIEADSSRNGSHDLCPWNRPLDAIKPLPRPLQLPTIFGLIFPLKTHVFSLCSGTFDRFVKELSEFQGRSVVHRDPPAFRLDCEAIGVGLITNFSLISSNFPLQFRTSTRKNPSKFASIHENWSPILAAIGLVTCRFRASLKHKYDGQTKFIKPNSQRQDIIIKYWVSIASIHREQGWL